MNVLILTVALVANPTDDASQAAEERPYHEISVEIRTAMRQEVTAETPAERIEAIRTMARLHGELLGDSRYETSDTLKAYRVKLWSRLRRVKRQLEVEIARQAEHPPSPVDQELEYATSELASHLALVGHSLGGPAHVFNASGGAAGGRAITDYGPDLVDLIERTINPAFWDTNGGPGSIFYFAPLRVLVVSATSEVHARIGGVVGGLRAAGN
jgi:hypothetical protein